MRELLARAMYGKAHPHGNDTQVAVGSSGARHRGSRADVTVRPQSPLTIVSRRRLGQFALTSRLSVWLKACLKKAHTRLRIRTSKERYHSLPPLPLPLPRRLNFFNVIKNREAIEARKIRFLSTQEKKKKKKKKKEKEEVEKRKEICQNEKN